MKKWLQEVRELSDLSNQEIAVLIAVTVFFSAIAIWTLPAIFATVVVIALIFAFLHAFFGLPPPG